MKNPWMRAGVAIAAVGAIGFATTAPAHADDTDDYKYGGLFGASPGYVLNTVDGEVAADTTGVYPEEDEAGEARAYRLDTLPVTDDLEMVYEERAWSESPLSGLAKANWIINHSYPILDAATLADKAEADLSGVEDPDLVAYTATQAAIWAHTEEVELDDTDATDQDEAVDAAVIAIADYLYASGEELAEPDNDFAIDTSEAEDGEKRLGPFTLTGVDNEGWVMALKEDGHEGGKVVDENGDKLAHVDNGQKFYVEPDAGVEKLELGAIAKDAPKAGTLMAARSDEGQPSLLLAEDAGYGAVADATVTVGGGDGQLPVTGTSLTGAMGVGALLLLGGAVVLFVMHRRQPTTEATA